MTKKYTVRVQERPGKMVIPVSVVAADTEDAIREAADHMALHGEIHRVDVYPGHDGWYDTTERIWTGSLTWSQASDADCVMAVA